MTTGPAPEIPDPPDYIDDKMTDDGCPLTRDPAHPCDDDWRDNIGEYDAFGDEPARPPAALVDRRGQ